MLSNVYFYNFDDDVFGALFEFKWCSKKDKITKLDEKCVDSIDHDILNRSIFF